MINKRRVRLMTKLAIYEKNEGPADEKIDAYFKTDYISVQMLRSFLSATISFVLMAGVYAFYNFEEMMISLYSFSSISSLIGRFAAAYFIFLLIFLVITYVLYAGRYKRSRRNLKAYYSGLKTLAGMYENKEES